MQLMQPLTIRFRWLWAQRSGSILVETALVLPILLLLLAGAFELGRFMLANQKVSALAASMADMISQADQGISESEINDVFGAIEHVSKPFDVGTDGRVIVSGVIGTSGNGNVVNWQRCAGGELSVRSQIGTQGARNVTLPGNLDLLDGDMAIVAEASFNYEPWIFFGFFDPQTLRSSASFRPRFGAMDTVTNDAPASNC
ncbi:hypothetical protein GCM10007972_04750 [Iodidimonas muriae]|uniref:TadE-like domain-containing protein n=1 Tax=Iodidimonas muriae TaxID=261467 RepID=A0ABQ2L846_9PROT|nr:TadE/TadG family type IV pilus assembly protein [Iodidimonas muriae]GER08190.1 hypothetical protein JCM17843_25000 [Kordiimonadales bacterium JCM 17843]GGO06406.1 hypothetical protein GCM10007972_04750 [Iodidimonas muriae]